MKIIQVLSSIVLVYSYNYEYLYNNVKNTIIRKIKEQDFYMIYHSKRYLRVMINFDADNNILRGNITEDVSQSENQFSQDFFIARAVFLDPSNIAVEIENQLKRTGKILETDFIVLVYNHHDYNKYNVMKDLIEEIKNLNIKKNRTLTKLHYEYIIKQNCDFEKILSKAKFEKTCNNVELGNFDVPIHHVRKNYKNYVNFSIDTAKICYFFEISYNEIDGNYLYKKFIATKLTRNNYYKDIQRGLYLLHNFINKKERDLHPQSSALKCTYYSIEFDNKNFIELHKENGKIIFNQRGVNYSYALQKNVMKEIESTFKKISDIQNGLDFIKVELFFDLLVNKNEIKTILHNILNKPESAINLIFIHLLLFDGVITESELKQLRKNFRIHEKRRTFFNVLKNKPLNHIEMISQSASDMLKLCIFIEAENYMNENDLDFDSLFYKIRKIGKQIIKHEFKEVGSYKINLLLKTKIDLMKIYDEVYYHLDDIINVNDEFAKIVSEIMCLFKGNDNYYINEVNYKGNLNEIMKPFKYKEDFIERTNKEILNKLEIYSNDKKIKKIIGIIQKSPLRETLDEIITESKNKKDINIFDEQGMENIMTEFIKKGNKEIEKIFNGKEIKKFLTTKNEALIKKYKNKLYEDFKDKITLIMRENIRKTFT
ncbi:putative SP-containing protein [Vairimorpha necatrix]|uniref:SP-containing protein n=1 Tax=Vairimorpha necatrix TaxID=6039 RepID=A0AAX4JCL5_9MICR